MSTWMEDAPGTMVGAAVVGVAAAVVRGTDDDVLLCPEEVDDDEEDEDDVVVVVWAAALTAIGARVADGISSAPTTPATPTWGRRRTQPPWGAGRNGSTVWCREWPGVSFPPPPPAG